MTKQVIKILINTTRRRTLLLQVDQYFYPYFPINRL
jgi:hypothetical protein